MVSKRLLGAYAFSSFAMLVIGTLSVVLSIIWRSPDLMRNLIINSKDLTAGLILGILYLVTFAISVGAILQPIHVTTGFIVLNWTLLLDSIATITVGSLIWFYTLTERADFHEVMAAQSTQTRQTVQDLFKCCGYFNSTDLGVSAGFCADPTFALNATPCVTPITADADYTLNNTFTTIYGFMAVIVALFLASMCVIQVREETERFRKIDEKRGGRGFV